MKINSWLVLFFPMLVLLSCGKSDNNSTTLNSPKTRLDSIAGKWKYTHMMWDENDNRIMDDYLTAVSDTIFYNYSISGPVFITINSGPTLTVASSWSLKDNGSKLEEIDGAITSLYNIHELTGTKFTIGSSLNNGSIPGSPMMYGWLIYTR